MTTLSLNPYKVIASLVKTGLALPVAKNLPVTSALNVTTAKSYGATSNIFSNQIPIAPPVIAPPVPLNQLPTVSEVVPVNYWELEDGLGARTRLPAGLKPLPGSFFPECDSNAYNSPGSDEISYYGDKLPLAKHLEFTTGFFSYGSGEEMLTFSGLKALKQKLKEAVILRRVIGNTNLKWNLKLGHSSILNERIVNPSLSLFNCKFAVKELKPKLPISVEAYAYQGAGSRFQFQQDTVGYMTLNIPAAYAGKIAIIQINNLVTNNNLWVNKGIPVGWIKLVDTTNYAIYIFNVNFTNGSLTQLNGDFYKIEGLNLPFFQFEQMSHYYNLLILAQDKLISQLNYTFVHVEGNQGQNPNVFGQTINANPDSLFIMMSTVLNNSTNNDTLGHSRVPPNSLFFKKFTTGVGTFSFAAFLTVPEAQENSVFSFNNPTSYDYYNLQLKVLL